MNWKLKRKEIRQKHFSSIGLIIISILGAAGLFIIYYSGIFDIEDSSMLYECISRNGILIIFGAFFFGVCLYCWWGFFCNMFLQPKKEIVYLKKIDNGLAIFLNKKGKAFNCVINQIELVENSYYYVLKTHDYIYEILERTLETWDAKEKKSYWLNCYLPIGKFENIILLPIVYVILLPGVLSILMSNGEQMIYGVIYSIVPLYFILYDWAYKMRLKKSQDIELDTTNSIKSLEILKAVILIIIFGMMLKQYAWMSTLIALPISIIILCVVGAVLSRALQINNMEKMFYKICIIIFLILFLILFFACCFF